PIIVGGMVNGAVNSGTIGTVGNISGFVAGSSEPFEPKKDRERSGFVARSSEPFESKKE
ncbi:10_t:CDS:1, partial [Cetraspora pellucida]